MDLNAAALFVKVVRYGSFSETARRTNTPVATVSRHIKQLETDLGFRLLERSTRHLRLTDAGASFLDYANQGVEAFESGRSALDHHEIELSGKLRLSFPNGFLPCRKLLQDFQVRYPNVSIELLATERKIDLIEDGIDVALRIGRLKDNQAVSQKLGSYRHLLVASPALLDEYSNPQHPQELLSLPCAKWRDFNNSNIWQLGDESVQIHPFFQVNDYLHLLYLALEGSCITELPSFLSKCYLENAQLVPVLESYPLPTCELHLLYPSRKQLSRLVKTFIDFCCSSGALSDLLF
ncbi:MAG: LysR family transcriptional regulator [Cyanobacteria bacterium J06560_6]